MDGAAADIVAHVKYALRRLKKSPGFTATVVVTLALGIGATTAVFTLIQQVMLRFALSVAMGFTRFGLARRALSVGDEVWLVLPERDERLDTRCPTRRHV